MSNQKASCQDTENNLTYEECRKHCACLNNSLKAMAIGYAFGDEFSDYDREHLLHLHSLIPTPKNEKEKRNLTEEDLPFVLNCVKDWAHHMATDPEFSGKLQTLINRIYDEEYKDNWEWCLNHKSKANGYHDYLYGCFSKFKNDPNALRHRNSHQFCIANESFRKAEKLLSKKLEAWLNESETFEVLYSKFSESENESIGGLGPLCV